MAAPFLKHLFSTIQLGDMQSFEDMAICPLLGRDGATPPYLLLSDAFDEKTVKIEELDESGQVSELFVSNNGDSDILIFLGEELIGAKQNRAVNISMIIEKQNSITIPVSCTERGRWV